MRQSARFDPTLYGPQQRLAYAEKHIRQAAEEGWLEQTQGWQVAKTYGVKHDEVKAMKARFRNELSFGGDGK